MLQAMIALTVLGAEPPTAARKDHVTTLHGETIADPYFWLREKKNAEVIAHLDAENAYTKDRTKHLEAFQEKLYQEGLARFEQTDLSVPTPEGGHLYYSRTVKGQQYPLQCRKKGE
ncbi:MAG: oligopeptidase B, partial [Gemmataceae bacterium]